MKKAIFIIILITASFCTWAEEVNEITLTEIGQGKTKEEAKNNALRNAVEKAFGTFISSNTTVMNDNLVKDEIVSVTNGNIKKFKILSETVMPDGSFSNVTEVTVSIEKMAKFCKNKGMSVEFDGESFAANVKLQQLNKTNEEKVIQNMITVITEIAKKGFDYSVSAQEPISIQNNWKIALAITSKANSNLVNIQKILQNTINGISLKTNELETYKKQESTFYSLKIDGVEYYLRNDISVTSLIELFARIIPECSKRFIIQNGMSNADGIQIVSCIKNNYKGRSKQTDYSLCNYWWGNGAVKCQYDVLGYLSNNEVNQIIMGEKTSTVLSEAYIEKRPAWAYQTQYQKMTKSFQYSTIINTTLLGKMEIVYNLDQILSAESLAKIKKYEIKPIN